MKAAIKKTITAGIRVVTSTLVFRHPARTPCSHGPQGHHYHIVRLRSGEALITGRRGVEIGVSFCVFLERFVGVECDFVPAGRKNALSCCAAVNTCGGCFCRAAIFVSSARLSTTLWMIHPTLPPIRTPTSRAWEYCCSKKYHPDAPPTVPTRSVAQTVFPFFLTASISMNQDNGTGMCIWEYVLARTPWI